MKCLVFLWHARSSLYCSYLGCLSTQTRRAFGIASILVVLSRRFLRKPTEWVFKLAYAGIIQSIVTITPLDTRISDVEGCHWNRKKFIIGHVFKNWRKNLRLKNWPTDAALYSSSLSSAFRFLLFFPPRGRDSSRSGSWAGGGTGWVPSWDTDWALALASSSSESSSSLYVTACN